MDDRKLSANRFRFPARTMLIIVTGVVLMFAILRMTLPEDFPLGYMLIMYGVVGWCTISALWSSCRSVTNPWTGPTDFVMVKVDVKWKRRIKSPWIIGPIATLTGVSLSFAPVGLLWCGQFEKFGVSQWIVAPLCLVVIYVVPGFFMSLGGEVIAELMRAERASSNAEAVSPDRGRP